MGRFRDHYLQLNQDRGEVQVDEWKVTFFVGPLTHAQVRRITQLKEQHGGAYALIAVCAKNAEGAPAFDDDELQELREYGDAHLMNAVADKIDAHHRRFQEAVEGKKTLPT